MFQSPIASSSFSISTSPQREHVCKVGRLYYIKIIKTSKDAPHKLQENVKIYFQAVLDFIKHSNWSKVALIYDDYTQDTVILQVFDNILSDQNLKPFSSMKVCICLCCNQACLHVMFNSLGRKLCL